MHRNNIIGAGEASRTVSLYSSKDTAIEVAEKERDTHCNRLSSLAVPIQMYHTKTVWKKKWNRKRLLH
jgi:hypothetical protein